MTLAVVTDSTARLPAAHVARYGLRVVPLQVVIGGQVFDEDAEATPADLAEALREWRPVTTSRPAPERFARVYAELSEAGASGIVSIHLSGDMSGTLEAARLAAAEAPVPVRVVDTRLIGMGLGFAVLAAAEAAATGADLDKAAAVAAERAAGTRVLLYVDTLEHLRRGGRIGAAATLVGSALMIKPLLHLVDGRIAPLEKVRTASRAIARMEDLAVAAAGEHFVDIAVQHLVNDERATGLASRLRERVPALRELVVGEVGAVIGAHAGPGMLAVVIAPVSPVATGS